MRESADPERVTTGSAYAARLARLAGSGMDLHGEARFLHARLAGGSRVLDAGCGTGRVAIRLAELGHTCVGVDVEDSMLAEARASGAPVLWVRADLRALDLRGTHGPQAGASPFDAVIAAGNVVALVPPGAVPEVLARVAAHLRPGGLFVAGFGLARAHLPPDAAVIAPGDYDAWCAAAGLELLERHATWDGEPYAGGTYAVSVHRRRPGPAPA